jgi:peptide chain release factor 2
VEGLDGITHGLDDAGELLELSADEGDDASIESVARDVKLLGSRIGKLEFQRMFSGEMDSSNAFVDIQAGAGGTEAQDWAEMLLRMYLRWAEDKGWQTELLEASEGEVAGIKSATFRVAGDYAYGWLKTEIGVHRLVR